jgi:uncharacterized protein YbaR (Trm112 family)
MSHTDIYQREIYLGDYRVEWSDQKISVTCSCPGKPHLSVFSDRYTTCPECGRQYSISEIIKVELPDGLIMETAEQGDVLDIIEEE